MDHDDSEKIKKVMGKRSIDQKNADGEMQDAISVEDARDKKRFCDSMHFPTFPRAPNPAVSFALPLLSVPKVEEWCSVSSISLTGTACSARTGPPVGVVDIGISKSAYYFCISLPGVKKDPGEFNCEIQRDGKVCVRGVTSTGEKIITKYSRVFVMKLQQQCPPGPFTLYFSLPGPVDPRLFAPSFRSDGIFEGVVAKFEYVPCA